MSVIEYVRPPLYAKQRDAIFDCYDLNGTPARYAFIEASTKAGKAQPLDALVYTPTGPKAMGRFSVGDRVLTPTGVASVVGVYPQGIRPIYRVTFSDGSSCEADGEHLWEVHGYGRSPVIVTTHELRRWPEWKFSRAWVPAVEPVSFDAQDVPLDPYLVGLLIGDGGTNGETIKFSSADHDLVESMRALLPAGHTLVHEGRADYRITAASAAAAMREAGAHIGGILKRLGLRGLAHEKRIPECYRYNAAEVRRAVLQGILDTDGFVDKHGQPCIEQTSADLAADIAEVVRSLGGTVLTRYRETNGYRDADGAFVNCRPVWRQVIRFADASWCFRLPRKRAAVRPRSKTGHRMFERIEISRFAQAQCIEIDDPRHLYLTNDLIPTHNTAGCLVWLLEQALQGRENWNYWWVAPVYGQAKIAYRRMKAGLPKELFRANEQDLTITLINGATIWFKSGEKPDNLYGDDVYAAVLDEASRMREEAWHAIRSTLTATNGPLRAIGNVKGRKNWFFRLARTAEAGAAGMSYSKLTAYDAVSGGVLKSSEIEDARRLLPEQVFRELYLAEPSDDGGNPFGLSHIAACVGPMSDAKPVAIGIDLAKSVDFTVVIGLDKHGRVCGFERWQHRPWSETTRDILALIGSTPTLVDSTGVGDPIVEELQRKKPGLVEGYTFTAGSKQKLMEGLAVAIQSRQVTYPDGPIRLELENFEYAYGRTGVKYSAPEGMHDDCVASLALAREKLRQINPVYATEGGVNIPKMSSWFSGDYFSRQDGYE